MLRRVAQRCVSVHRGVTRVAAASSSEGVVVRAVSSRAVVASVRAVAMCQRLPVREPSHGLLRSCAALLT